MATGNRLTTGESASSAGAVASERHRRCQAAITGDAVDQAPTYMCAISCEVASKILNRPAHTGTGSLHYAEVLAWAKGDAAHEDFEAQFLQDIVDIHRALNVDVFRMPWRMNVKPTQQLDEHTFIIDHAVWRYNPETADFGVVSRMDHSLADENELEKALDQAESELPRRKNVSSSLPDDQAQICEQFGSEFFVVCNGGGISVGLGDEDLMMLVTRPDLTRRKLMLKAESVIRLGTALARSPWPRVLIGGGDLADNRGTLYSVKSFREVVLPAYEYALRNLKELGVHYVFRSDGNLWPIADLLFGDAGCPGYGEVDREAGMTLGKLRHRFPRLAIWGNVSSSFLQRSTIQQVKDECRRIIDESGGSGYFHGCSNAIITGTPPENAEAMYSVR